MGRILAIDYGAVRTGLAWTDPLGMIASPLPACYTKELWAELSRRVAEGVAAIVLGFPTRLDGRDTDSTEAVRALQARLLTEWPHIPVHLQDERLSSKLAAQAMQAAGATRKQKQNKMLENSVAATIILQNFLG